MDPALVIRKNITPTRGHKRVKCEGPKTKGTKSLIPMLPSWFSLTTLRHHGYTMYTLNSTGLIIYHTLGIVHKVLKPSQQEGIVAARTLTTPPGTD
jgi:hypothetical protein